MTSNTYSFFFNSEIDLTSKAGYAPKVGETVLVSGIRYQVKAVLGSEAMLYDIERGYTRGWMPFHKLEAVA